MATCAPAGGGTPLVRGFVRVGLCPTLQWCTVDGAVATLLYVSGCGCGMPSGSGRPIEGCAQAGGWSAGDGAVVPDRQAHTCEHAAGARRGGGRHRRRHQRRARPQGVRRRPRHGHRRCASPRSPPFSCTALRQPVLPRLTPCVAAAASRCIGMPYLGETSGVPPASAAALVRGLAGVAGPCARWLPYPSNLCMSSGVVHSPVCGPPELPWSCGARVREPMSNHFFKRTKSEATWISPLSVEP